MLCGSAWFDETFRQLDPAVQIHWHGREGAGVGAGRVAVRTHGPARAMLTGERTALNFLQTLSATATATRAATRAPSAGTALPVLDTRKTMPGLRCAQKYAVRAAAAATIGIGLHERVLIKENHIAAAGSIAAAVVPQRPQAPCRSKSKRRTSPGVRRGPGRARATIIMLDDFTLERHARRGGD